MKISQFELTALQHKQNNPPINHVKPSMPDVSFMGHRYGAETVNNISQEKDVELFGTTVKGTVSSDKSVTAHNSPFIGNILAERDVVAENCGSINTISSEKSVTVTASKPRTTTIGTITAERDVRATNCKEIGTISTDKTATVSGVERLDFVNADKEIVVTNALHVGRLNSSDKGVTVQAVQKVEDINADEAVSIKDCGTVQSARSSDNSISIQNTDAVGTVSADDHITAINVGQIGSASANKDINLTNCLLVGSANSSDGSVSVVSTKPGARAGSLNADKSATAANLELLKAISADMVTVSDVGKTETVTARKKADIDNCGFIQQLLISSSGNSGSEIKNSTIREIGTANDFLKIGKNTTIGNLTVKPGQSSGASEINMDYTNVSAVNGFACWKTADGKVAVVTPEKLAFLNGERSLVEEKRLQNNGGIIKTDDGMTITAGGNVSMVSGGDVFTGISGRTIVNSSVISGGFINTGTITGNVYNQVNIGRGGGLNDLIAGIEKSRKRLEENGKLEAEIQAEGFTGQEGFENVKNYADYMVMNPAAPKIKSTKWENGEATMTDADKPAPTPTHTIELDDTAVVKGKIKFDNVLGRVLVGKSNPLRDDQVENGIIDRKA